jgi:AcrR family transcriptional regulator
MSPAPSRTSVEAIVAAARRILETDGLAAVTMRSVAEAVGVQGPSLYKRVPDRAALVRAVADGVVADLAGTLARATETGDPHADLRAVAGTYRDFVHRNPNGYRLLFADLPAGAAPDPAALAALAEPIVAAMRALSGELDALEGARTVVAWAHGFVTMELAGAFRLGGDLDAAYAFGIESILAGVRSPANPASRSGRRAPRRTQ